MDYLDNRSHFRIQTTAKNCTIPDDERSRMQARLQPLENALREFAEAHLWITITYHDLRQEHHVEMKLKVPGRTLFTGRWDAYLDVAFGQALEQIEHKLALVKQN